MRISWIATTSIFLWALTAQAHTVCLANLDATGSWQIQHRFSPSDFNGQEDVRTSLISHTNGHTQVHDSVTRRALPFDHSHPYVDRYDFPVGTVLSGSSVDGSLFKVELISLLIYELAGTGILVKTTATTSGKRFLSFTCT